MSNRKILEHTPFESFASKGFQTLQNSFESVGHLLFLLDYGKIREFHREQMAALRDEELVSMGKTMDDESQIPTSVTEESQYPTSVIEENHRMGDESRNSTSVIEETSVHESLIGTNVEKSDIIQENCPSVVSSDQFIEQKLSTEKARRLEEAKTKLKECLASKQVKLQEHAMGFKCLFCVEVFSTKSGLERHYFRIHKDGDMYKCNKCLFKTENIRSLQEHLRKHNSKASFCCEICGLQFNMHGRFKRHMRRHSDTNSFKCRKCDKGFATEYKLNMHRKMTHQGLHLRPCICDICGRSLKTQHNLNVHMRSVHENARSLKCQYCDFSANASGNLNAHIKKRHPEKWVDPKLLDTAVSCELCEYTTNRYGMIHHMKYHHASESQATTEKNAQ